MFQREQVDSVSMSLVYHTMQGLTTGCGLANLTLPSLCQTYRLLHCTQTVAAKNWKYHPERDLTPPEQFTNTNSVNGQFTNHKKDQFTIRMKGQFTNHKKGVRNQASCTYNCNVGREPQDS